MKIKDADMPREEVLKVAIMMEKKLRKHDHGRGPKGWKNHNPVGLLMRVEEELNEAMTTALGKPEAISGELVDVMNMAMMAIDQFGCLDPSDDALGYEGKVPFTKADVMDSLDRLIFHWRDERDKAKDSGDFSTETTAEIYIDAYQSVRMNLFGASLPE